MKKTVFSIIIFTAFSVYINAWDFIPAFDLNGGLTYPTVVSSQPEELDKKLGLDSAMAGSFMMNSDILPQIWFIPTLTFNYNNTAQPLNIEDERFLFAQWMDIYFSYGANYEFSENWEARARGFIRYDYSLQTADEVFGKGLYDYRDKGFYIENVNYIDSKDLPMELLAGFKYTDRRFPNYTSLLTELEPGELGYETPNTYTKEKDNLTYSLYVSDQVKWGESKWYSTLSLSYDYIPYLEQKIINPDGSFSSANRKDRYFIFSLSFPYYADDVSGVELGYELTAKTTDQNYYDTLGDIDPSNDVFTRNYYNYILHSINAALYYELQMHLFSAYKPVALIGYSMDIYNYSDRPAKDAEGNYIDAGHNENNYTISLDLRQNITENWNYYLNGSFTRYSSNTKWEAYGSYNYTYVTVSIGSAVSF